jgi:hypothetical protein
VFFLIFLSNLKLNYKYTTHIGNLLHFIFSNCVAEFPSVVPDAYHHPLFIKLSIGLLLAISSHCLCWSFLNCACENYATLYEMLSFSDWSCASFVQILLFTIEHCTPML